jgi:transglutaminase-like putative cysteine protease
MQTNLGGSISEAGIVASYSYAARYHYTDVVVQNDNFLRLSACADTYQTPVTASVMTSPVSRPAQFRDAYGNITHRVRVTTPHQELIILAIGVVRIELPPALPAEVAMRSLVFDQSVNEFLTPTPLVDPEKLAAIARDITWGAEGLLESVTQITDWVYRNINYVKQSTTVATTAEHVLASGMGVCQDKAHLAMGFLKALGIPARYVSGLLATQVGETHAWLEFLHPQLGWLPADPTRGQALAGNGDLIKFAVGRDYTQAAPVEGTFVSRGSGWLDTALAQVQLEADLVSFDDALRLIENRF